MSDVNAENAVLAISETFLTTYNPIAYLKLGFLVAFLIYICGWPFYGSKKSFWDAIAAKKITFTLLCLVSVELVIILPLLYCVIALGPPINDLNAMWKLTAVGYNQSWIYGYGRPITCFLLIGFGSFSGMHTSARIICLLGAFEEIICCSFSCVQVYDYYLQSTNLQAPTGNFTSSMLYYYFMRDVVSASLCLLIVLYSIHLSTLLGWGLYQVIPYSVIHGGDLDRCEVMRKHRFIKKMCEFKHELNVIQKIRDIEADQPNASR